MSRHNWQRLNKRVLEFAEAQFDVGLYAVDRQIFNFIERLSPSSTSDTIPLTIPLERHYVALHGPLVILAEQGAGKTTLLHELACIRQSKEANDRDRLPVVFELRTWAHLRLPLSQWLASELNRKYGVGSLLAKRWVENDFVVPMLDGLDTVPLAYRPVCVREINEYCRAHAANKIVVTCREEEYREITDSVTIARTGGIDAASIVIICPLTPADVMRYLDRNASKFEGLRIALHSNQALWKLMTTPLMMWIAAAAFESANEEAIAKIYCRNSGSLPDELFGCYLKYMLRRQDEDVHRNIPSTANATRWLEETAAAMTRAGTFAFRLEDISSAWLPGGKPQLGNLIIHIALGFVSAASVGIPVAIIVGWVDAQVYGMSDGVTVGLWVGLEVSLAAGLMAGLVPIDKISPVDDVTWSWSSAGQGLSYGIFWGLSLALPLAWGFTALTGFATDLFFGFSLGLGFGFVGDTVNARSVANGGLKQSAVSAFLYFVLLLAPASVLVALAGIRGDHDLSNPILVCAAGLCVLAPVLALCRGGAFCVKNLIMRAVLATRGHTPWRYAALLQFAADRALMIRQGGSFRFIHPMFQEYLALRKAPAPVAHRQDTASPVRYDPVGLLELLKQNSIVPPREKFARDARELPNTSQFLQVIPYILLTGLMIVAQYLDLGVVALFVLAGLAMATAALAEASKLDNRALRSRVRDAFAELDRLPNRRPILFLRSFSREIWEVDGYVPTSRTGDPLEKIVAYEMHDLGPVIAVGRPGETLPPIGAARFYLKGENWQPIILKLLTESQFVVIVCGATANLLWEFARIVEHVHPTRLIVCIPKQRTMNEWRSTWQHFRESTINIFPQPLPDDPEKSALFLRFDAAWQPILVYATRRYRRKAIRAALRECIEAATS